MSDGDCTRCGHDYYDHGRRGKTHPCATFRHDREPQFCKCVGYTCAVLPAGERLEFGKHRLDMDEAETAPAWPPLR